jgi:hypothetical protein
MLRRFQSRFQLCGTSHVVERKSPSRFGEEGPAVDSQTLTLLREIRSSGGAARARHCRFVAHCCHRRRQRRRPCLLGGATAPALTKGRPISCRNWAPPPPPHPHRNGALGQARAQLVSVGAKHAACGGATGSQTSSREYVRIRNGGPVCALTHSDPFGWRLALNVVIAADVRVVEAAKPALVVAGEPGHCHQAVDRARSVRRDRIEGVRRCQFAECRDTRA